MWENRELKAAFAVMASVAGVGFASGREIVLFFAQLGWAAWPGMLTASALFALLMRLVMGAALRTGASDLTGAFTRITGVRRAGAVSLLYGVLMAFAAVIMLRTCGELGALTLPVQGGYLKGVLLALLLATAVCAGRRQILPVLGAAAVITALLFYGGLMLDARPVRVNMRCETVLNLSGSLWAAAIFGLLHACLNASVAAGTAAAFSGGRVDPGKASAMTGGMMLACLMCAHGAMLRGGETIYAQSLPTVLLAARWGVRGFWLSAGYMYFASVCTLAASMSTLVSRMGEGQRCGKVRNAVVWAAILLICLRLSDAALGCIYPLMGWICAFFLIVPAFVQGDVNPDGPAWMKGIHPMKKMTEIDVKF